MKEFFHYCIIIVLFGSALPLFVQKLLGITFTPSSEWVQLTARPASILGLLLGIAASVFLWRTRNSNPALQNRGEFEKGVIILSTPLMMQLFGFLFGTTTLPMLHAAAIRTPQELPFIVIVSDPTIFRDRKCRPAIEIADMAFSLDKLCGTPEELQVLLSPGDTVFAVGKGSRIGVFYDSFRY